MPRKRRRAILIGLGVGAVGVVLSLIPFILNLEENAELDWLFSKRGEVAAPSNVIVIGIDEQTATVLGVSDDLDEWPRSIHADLVDRLATAGASAIVFDINFAEERSSEDDQAFADAIQRAGNVVLLEYVEVGSQSPEEPADGAPQVLIERRFPPIGLLRDQAIGTAPFLLPVVPVKVSRIWSFGPTTDNSPSLPVVALQTYASRYYTDFLNLLGDVRPDAVSGLPQDTKELVGNNSLPAVILKIRGLFRTDPQIALDMNDSLDRHDIVSVDEETRSVLLALIAMYQGVGSPYLNFYGPPHTITTVPYQDALQIPFDEFSALGVEGRVAFVGYSARTLMGQQDAHYSVFSQDSGLNLSGAEIAATAFANLLELNSIKPLDRPARLAFVFLWGIILTIALCFLSTTLGIGLAVVGGISYITFTSHQFASAAAWWPIIVPILIQMPIALYGANRLQLAEEKTKNEQLFSGVIASLNPQIVDQLKRNIAGLVENRYVNGTCLFTDIKDYTAITDKYERKGRDSEFQERLHQYWVLVVTQIAQCGGFVDVFQGDSCLGVWPGRQRSDAACKAALGICKELERFNRSDEHPKLITRIGAHFGQFWIGSKGLVGEGAVRSGGTLNIASRIEAANKDLRTQAMVSEQVLEELESDFVTRPLGAFLVKGKDEPLQLHELMAVADIDQSFLEDFAEALNEFRKENWEQAAEIFKTLCEKFEQDGPHHFYLPISKRYAESGPDKNWDGVALRVPLDTSA
jgi:adenylate cyclase